MSADQHGKRRAEAPEAHRQKCLKPVGVFALIACACLVGYLKQQLALAQLEPSIESGVLKTAAVIDVPVVEKALGVDPRSSRPLFGMATEPVDGKLALKWRTVQLEIEQEQEVLADCRARKPCPEPARELLNIVAEADGRTGRARIGLINRAVNHAITPTADEAQWGVRDHWSPPLETLQSHRGDCEDYAIVKYVALRKAGLSGEDVKVVIMRNFFPDEYHAVAVARVNGEWLIMDNRRLTLVSDTDMMRATPEFLLDESGVRRFISSRGTLLSSLTKATRSAPAPTTISPPRPGELRIRHHAASARGARRGDDGRNSAHRARSGFGDLVGGNFAWPYFIYCTRHPGDQNC